MPLVDDAEASVRRTALIVLGVVTSLAVAGIVIIAATTDRELTSAVRGLVIALAIIAFTGGAVFIWGPQRNGRKHKREIGEDDDVPD
jgi:hypothetical protein